MIKVALIEDEIPARTTIKSYLKRYFPQAEVVVEIDRIKDFVDFAKGAEVDIVFLDVQLKDGKTVDVLEKIDTSRLNIIFTTAYNDYTHQAFINRAFGYLVKPIDPDDFQEIVARVIARQEIKKITVKQFKVPVHGGYKYLMLSSVVRFESDSNYTHLYTIDKQKYTVAKTLKMIEAELGSALCRVHQSHLVNKSFISKEIVSGQLLLTTGELIPISRSKRAEIMDELFGKND